MPKAPRLKLSRSTRMGPSDQINVLHTTPTPPAEPNDLDLSALTISPLHRINVPRTTSNRRDKTENPAPPTLTMDSLGVRAMENGRLTHAAMTHITKTYILSLTEEARARIVVQNHRNPDRKDRRKLKKKPADAVKVGFHLFRDISLTDKSPVHPSCFSGTASSATTVDIKSIVPRSTKSPTSIDAQL